MINPEATDTLLTCPYDPVHRILKSRMQFHLTRCVKNHPEADKTKRQCPFNARHIVNAVELNYHIENCPERESVYRYQNTEATSINVLPIINAPVYQVDEDWETEPSVESYNPLKKTQTLEKPIYQCLIGASKAKRKEFRKKQRLIFQQAENNQEKNTSVELEKSTKNKDVSNNKPLRRPKSSNLNNSNTSFNSSYMNCSYANTSRYDTTVEETLVSINDVSIESSFEEANMNRIRENEKSLDNISKNFDKLNLSSEVQKDSKDDLRKKILNKNANSSLVNAPLPKSSSRVAANFCNRK